MDKAWNLDGYRFGAAAFALLTVLVPALLVGRLRSDGPAIRWFAAGLSASMVGGITQALTVFNLGATLPGAASYAVLLGHLIESACWMMALASRFRADRLGMQRQLECEANHDPLTGTFSRTALKQQIGQALASVKGRPEKCFGLLHLDLDRFKQVNDSLGHALSDQVLVAVAGALEGLNLPSDGIGRFSVDLAAGVGLTKGLDFGRSNTDCRGGDVLPASGPHHVLRQMGHEVFRLLVVVANKGVVDPRHRQVQRSKAAVALVDKINRQRPAFILDGDAVTSYLEVVAAERNGEFAQAFLQTSLHLVAFFVGHVCSPRSASRYWWYWFWHHRRRSRPRRPALRTQPL